MIVVIRIDVSTILISCVGGTLNEKGMCLLSLLGIANLDCLVVTHYHRADAIEGHTRLF